MRLILLATTGQHAESAEAEEGEAGGFGDGGDIGPGGADANVVDQGGSSAGVIAEEEGGDIVDGGIDFSGISAVGGGSGGERRRNGSAVEDIEIGSIGAGGGTKVIGDDDEEGIADGVAVGCIKHTASGLLLGDAEVVGGAGLAVGPDAEDAGVGGGGSGTGGVIEAGNERSVDARGQFGNIGDVHGEGVIEAGAGISRLGKGTCAGRRAQWNAAGGTTGDDNLGAARAGQVGQSPRTGVGQASGGNDGILACGTG